MRGVGSELVGVMGGAAAKQNLKWHNSEHHQQHQQEQQTHVL